MSHDVFISYSNRDKTVADAVCAVLERNAVRCWIAPRDVTPGIDWSAEIVDAIHDSRVMVLVYSSGANESQQIKREVERAVSRGIPILPFRIEDVPMSKSLEYFISSPHWLDALTPPLERHLEYLARTVQLLLSRLGPEPKPIPIPFGTATTDKPPAAFSPPASSPASAPNARTGGGDTPVAIPPKKGGRRITWLVVGALAAAAIWAYSANGRSGVGDPDLVGTWGLKVNNTAGLLESSFAIDRRGQYSIQTTVHDHGRVSGTPGTFEMISSTGTRISGTYRMLDAGSMQVTSAVGTVLWTRQPGSPAGPANAPGVGVWEAAPVVGGVTWHQTIENGADGSYALTSVSGDTGLISASAGHWHMVSHAGVETDGTYRLTNAQTLAFTGPLGASVWTKSQ